MVKLFSPATIGNVGPGFDVLGLAVSNLGDTFEVSLLEHMPSRISSVTGRDADLVPRDPSKNCVVIAAEAFLKSRGLSFGVEIAIARNLPISGGLGGSAAASVAGALGAAIACGVEYRQSEILHAALEGETAVAGRHLDNIAPCLLGGLAMVLSNSPPAIHPLPIKTKWWLALLTPNLKLETKLSRGVLPASLPTGEWTTILSRTIGLATAFASGDIDLFRSCFVDSFAEPRRSKLIPNFSAIKHAALSRGAIGCTISGAGPTIVAVCETEAIAHDSLKSMKDASPTHSFSHIGQCGGLGAREI